jgi:hypothetical protein
MRIEVQCQRCGTVTAEAFWSIAVTAAALHEHPAHVTGVLSRDDWNAIPPDDRVMRRRGWYGLYDYAVLQRDRDQSVVLVPVQVRG